MKIAPDILKPVFEVIAHIGVGLPHQGYEVSLMGAGKKPCLIALWPLSIIEDEDYRELTPLIESGDIIVAGTKEFKFPFHIICQPHLLEYALKTAKIHQKERSGLMLKPEEWQWKEAFLRDYCGIEVRDTEGGFVMDQLDERQSDRQGDFQLLLDGKITATLPIMTGGAF